MPSSLPFALYDAFADGAFGGATAGIVGDAAGLSAETMQAVAREVAAPATAFLRGVSPELIDVRFFSTLTEYGMCGHGTVALASHLVESGQIALGDGDTLSTVLRTRDGDAALELRREDGHVLVMLDLDPSRFEGPAVDKDELARVLGLTPETFDPDLPIEKAVGDFIHLIVPLPSLDAVGRIVPDFGAIADFSRGNGVQTVTVVTRETVHGSHTIHCRDFCPAVGTPESPAAGTTNGALTCYLVRHGLIETAGEGPVRVLSEQGYECGRPSLVRAEVTVANGAIARLTVGGTARKSMVGELFLPAD
jgi:PhzF family phenazine biosynthesis protein